jgi:hypothetical protein
VSLSARDDSTVAGPSQAWSSRATASITELATIRPSRRARWLRRLAAVLLATVVVAIIAQRFVATAHDLDGARRDLAASQTHLDRLRTDVRDAATVRRAAQRSAADAVVVLEAQRARRVTSGKNLKAAQAQLDLVHRQLAASLLDQQRAGNQVVALQRCLDGVSQSLNLIGVGDVHGWQEALAAVDAPCRAAALAG